jgi:hypothetical protein
MPCDSVIYNQVNLGKLDAELLKTALESLGAGYIYLSRNGNVEFYHGGEYYRIIDGALVFAEGARNIADDIKRGVGVAALYRDAKKSGFKVRKVSDTKYQVIRGAR